MKIWKFIKKPGKDDPFQYDNIEYKYPVYAIASNKKDAKEFIRTRNQDKFIKIVHDLEEDEYTEYLNAHRGKLLSNVKLETIKGKNTNNQIPMEVDVLITDSELNFVMEMVDTAGILNIIKNWIPIDIFRDDIREALSNLNYDKAATFSGYGNVNADFDMIYEIGYSFDQFGTFLALYGDTMSDDFFMSCNMNKIT